MPKENLRSRLTVAATVPLLFVAAASLFGIDRLWGSNLPKFLPPFWTYLMLTTAVVLILPSVAATVARKLNTFSELLAADKRLQMRLLAVLSATLLLLFLLFPSTAPLLGDGTLRKNQINNGQWWLPTELLDFLIHAALWQLVFKPLGLSVIKCYQIASAVSGVVFVVGVFRLAHYLVHKQSLLAMLLMLSSGMSVLFFGYVESYSILAAMLPHIVLAGLRAVDTGAGKIRFVAWYLAGGLVHSVSFWLFSGVLAVVLLSPAGNAGLTARRMSRYLLASMAAFLAMLYIGRFLGLGSLNRYLMPLVSSADGHQSILTIDHWLNLVNWVLLSALPSLFLGLLLLGRRRGTIWDTPRASFATWLAVPGLLFLFVFVPQLGAPQDWDLFSLPSFLLIPAALIGFLSIKHKPLPSQSLPVSFIAICVTAAFVVINSHVSLAALRFEEIGTLLRFRPPTREYVTLVNLSEQRPEIRQRRLDYALKVLELPLHSKRDSSSALSKVGECYAEVGDSINARRYLELAISTDTTDLTAHFELIRYHDQFSVRDTLLAAIELVENRFSAHAMPLAKVAGVYRDLDELDRAAQALERAYRIDSTHFEVLLNLGIVRIQQNQLDSAVTHLKELLRRDPDNFNAAFYLAIAYARQGDPLLMQEYASLAERLARTDFDRAMVWQLREQLRGEP